jgi:dolichol-phosphate mannosyltransferase
MRTVVVVPTYNEADNAARLIDAVHAVVPTMDLLVVDDSSPDGTAEVVAAIAARDRRVRLLVQRGPRSFARSYVAGFRDCIARGYDVICQMDCDLSHPPEVLRDFLRLIDRYDMVIGSRYMEGGGSSNWPLRRILLSRGGNLYARLVLGLPLSDLTAGFKCWRRATLAALAPELDSLMSSGFSFQMEMNYRTHRQGFSIGETPIVFPDRTAGASKMIVKEFWESLAMPWRLRLLVR